MRSYDERFFEYVDSGSIRSARDVLPILAKPLEVSSVLDVGCGQGAWLSVWRELGVEDITGLDGDYVQRDRLHVPASNFVATDLTRGFDVGRRFDLVQSLEVAEHLPAAAAATFVAALVAHGDRIFFSAAPKGQGGEHHINEQDYDYWRKLFAAHGYVAFDCIRPAVRELTTVEPWYRYNTFLYVARDSIEQLPPAIQATRVPDDSKLADVSPLLYQVRKQVIKWLPQAVVTQLARVNELVVARARRQHG
jgi:SAM-dependent methyltransferase